MTRSYQEIAEAAVCADGGQLDLCRGQVARQQLAVHTVDVDRVRGLGHHHDARERVERQKDLADFCAGGLEHRAEDGSVHHVVDHNLSVVTRHDQQVRMVLAHAQVRHPLSEFVESAAQRQLGVLDLPQSHYSVD